MQFVSAFLLPSILLVGSVIVSIFLSLVSSFLVCSCLLVTLLLLLLASVSFWHLLVWFFNFI